MVRLHLKDANNEIAGEYKIPAEIKIMNSEGQIIFELSSNKYEKIPDFEQFIGFEIFFKTKEGTIKGVVDKVHKLFGQEIYIFGEVISDYDLIFSGNCPFAYWNIVLCEPEITMIETQFAPIQIKLQEYLNLYSSINDLYYYIYRQLSILIKALPYFEQYSQLSIEALEKFLKDIIGKLLWLKKYEPEIYNELISVLQNKNIETKTKQEK